MTDRPTDRGVTEVLGFVLIFGLVLVGIVVVTATGMAGLHEVRDSQQLENAERSLDVLATNVDDLLWYGAPSRSTEVGLAGGQVSMGEPVTVGVTTHPVGDESATSTYEYETTPIVYHARTGTKLVYSNGAVFRQQRSGTVVVREPRLLLDDHRTTLPILRTRPAGKEGVGGTTNAQIRTSRTAVNAVVATSTPMVLTYTITSPRAAAWRHHLRATYPDASCTGDAEQVTCTVTTDRASVTVVSVDVTIR